MINFSEKEWITSDYQLRNYLKRCSQCFLSTRKGQLVMPYDQLLHMNLKRKKYSLVLNTVQSLLKKKPIGHWINFHIDNITKKALLHDPLNELEKSHPKVIEIVRNYCRINNLKLIILKLQTQMAKNLTCGLQCLWFTHKCHKLSIHGLLELKQVLKHQSVYIREQFIVKQTMQIYRI